MCDKIDIYCLSLALKYYSAEQLKHALKVAEYAVNAYSYLAADSDLERLWKIGLFHDILEDTACPEKELSTVLTVFEIKTIKLLTHSNEKSYLEYIHDIVDSGNFFAQAVKRADMKDHFMREATLTDKLKEKYYPVIKYLL